MADAEHEIATRETAVVAAAVMELSVEQVVDRVKKVHQIMQHVMRDGIHFGVIPGTERHDKAGKDISKKVLYKPGADILCMAFRLAPRYHNERSYDSGNLTVYSTCELIHQVTGEFIASGGGMCSSAESKYAYRRSERECPNCHEETIKRSKFPDKKTGKKGWYCFAKIGGCGAQFDEGDPAIESQEVGRTDNPDKPDQFNTVLKMAQKRSKIDAVINATGCSDVFTQDLGDDPKPGDKASTEMIGELRSAVISRLGKDGEKWLGTKLHDAGLKKWNEVTVEHVRQILAELDDPDALPPEPKAKDEAKPDATAEPKSEEAPRAASGDVVISGAQVSEVWAAYKSKQPKDMAPMQKLLKKYDIGKVSELPVARFAEFMAEIAALGGAGAEAEEGFSFGG